MKAPNPDKVLGCIFGGAIGDAFGGPYEGMSPPILIKESNEWRLSDDTQLTLATCESIANTGKVDPASIAAHFSEYYQSGKLTGLGASTLKALIELAGGGHWALVGRKGEMAAGNGAAMRIAPLAFVFDPNKSSDRRMIRDVCRITHHNEEAYIGALAVVHAVSFTSKGDWDGGSDLIAKIMDKLPDSRVRDRLHDLSQVDKGVPLRDIAVRFGSSGYVVDSVPIALCGACRVKALGFKSMMEQLVLCGGDTDTIASIAGQVAGSYVGYNEIPSDMVSRMVDHSMIRGIVDHFVMALRQ